MKLASAIYSQCYPFDVMGLFTEYNGVTRPDELDTDSALVVWGGGDISPTLYNKAVGKYTGADVLPSRRDVIEWDLMKRAEKLGIPIIGICRGAQMLCALAGGFLIQDVNNHTSAHLTETDDGEVFGVSSLHHQMLYPFEVDHVMKAWSKQKRSEGHYLDVDTHRDMPLEPEYVYFPKQKGLAIQWHPEYMKEDCKANMYVKKQIQELVLGA